MIFANVSRYLCIFHDFGRSGELILELQEVNVELQEVNFELQEVILELQGAPQAPGGHFEGPEAQNLDFCSIFNENEGYGGAQELPRLRC